jgi:histidinol-phosphate aminotransferase
MPQLSRRVQGLVQPHVRDAVPYDPDFTPCEVNLSANENSYGMPAGVRAAVNEAIAKTPMNRYPDAMANGLRDAIAAWYGVGRDNVCVGNGGDELIFNLFLAFGGEGRKLVDCAPSFSVYGLYAGMLGTTVERCWRDPDTYEVSMAELLPMAKDADIVIVTSPNNPTGNLFPREDVAALCKATKGVVLVDEAYIEFAEPSARCDMLLATYDNLLVLHTFSKAFAMAGVRVGYLLGAADLIDAFAAVRQPYTVDVFAQAAAQAVVANLREFDASIAHIKASRERFAQGLSELPGVVVWPSAANFLLARIPDAAVVRRELRDGHSILVRDFSSTQGLEDCLRITVGTDRENERVLEALGQILGEA